MAGRLDGTLTGADLPGLLIDPDFRSSERHYAQATDTGAVRLARTYVSSPARQAKEQLAREMARERSMSDANWVESLSSSPGSSFAAPGSFMAGTGFGTIAQLGDALNAQSDYEASHTLIVPGATHFARDAPDYGLGLIVHSVNAALFTVAAYASSETVVGPVAFGVPAAHSLDLAHTDAAALFGYDSPPLVSSAVSQLFGPSTASKVDMGLNIWTAIAGIEAPGAMFSSYRGVFGNVGIDGATQAPELYRLGKSVPPMERTYDHALSPQLYLEDLTQYYGINLRGAGQAINLLYDETLPPGQLGFTRAAEGGQVIRIGPDALADDATAANTIAHELSHARDYINGGIHKPHGTDASLDDGSVYGAGNALEDWINGKR